MTSVRLMRAGSSQIAIHAGWALMYFMMAKSSSKGGETISCDLGDLAYFLAKKWLIIIIMYIALAEIQSPLCCALYRHTDRQPLP